MFNIKFPALEPQKRDREYRLYTTGQCSEIVFQYLFHGTSHRDIDKNILCLDSSISKGYQSMSVLHYLGLNKNHKGIFKNKDFFEILKFLNLNNKIHSKIIFYLKYYINGNNLLNSSQKYLNEVIEAMIYYGGEASLEEIYSFIENNYGFSISVNSAKSMIRKTIYFNSSDADLYQGKQDIFYSVSTKGNGLWGFRLYVVTDKNIELSEDEKGFPEGKEKLKQHLIRERNPKIIREAKKLFKDRNKKLYCEVCNFDFEAVYGSIGEDYIEGHHIYPISEIDRETTTYIRDIVLLCSNCHKMIHRKRPWLTVEKLRELTNKKIEIK